MAASTVCSGEPAGDGRLAPRPMVARCLTNQQYRILRTFCTAICSETMRIGFFGGSFDPPHRGHVALARLARERLGLGRVLFAPVGAQPLKRNRPAASFDDRLAMTRLAIEGEPGLDLSAIDGPHGDGRPNYTIDVIRALRSALAPSDELYCLMGADSFLTIAHWYRAADLLMACNFAVASRPGFDLGRLTAALPESISVAACDNAPPGTLAVRLRNGEGCESRLYLLPDLAEDASATDIRAALQGGADPQAALHPRVVAYIAEHGLYRQVSQRTGPRP